MISKIGLVLLGLSLAVGQLDKAKVNGNYHLGTPERGKSQVKIEFGQFAGSTVLAVQADPRMQPAVYKYQKEPSETLGTPIFMTSGLYLIKYNDDSFIIVQPDGMLGRKVWSRILYSNIYSKSKSTASSTSKAAIQKFAIDLSSKIMNQDVGNMVAGSGNYYLAVPQTFAGKNISEMAVQFKTDGKKTITIQPGNVTQTFEHLPEESGIAQVDIYRYGNSDYLFDIGDGVLIYTFANAGGLGKRNWSEKSRYNVYSNNRNYIRQIVASKEKQNTIDQMMTQYFADIKTEFERRAVEKAAKADANRELPKQGLTDSGQRKQALAAAKRWASAWKWKETIKDAYFTSNDWSITRNRLTGVITGKVIRGFITMTHPDGRCRFQYVSFRMEYDGSNYTNINMTGVGPIYNVQCGKI